MSLPSNIDKQLPRISIITVCFNAQEHIEQTIQSVLAQDYPNIEYLIIDGASTDKTLSIIEPYKPSLDYFISEPDSGISNAMNKGIQAASGDYLLFLHADDYLLSSTSISEAANVIIENSNRFQMFAIGIKYGKPDNNQVKIPTGLNAYIYFKLRSGIHHQGLFTSKKLFKTIGLFDESLHICMDYDWFLRAYKHQVAALTNTTTISFMRDSGISGQQDWKSVQRRIMEEKNLHLKNSNRYQKYIYMIWWFIYPSIKHYKTILFKDRI